MSAPSSDTALQSIARDIEQFRRQSKSAIPAGVVGLILVVGGLVYSGWQLNRVHRDIAAKRQQVADLDLTLHTRATQLADSDKQLAALKSERERTRQELDALKQGLSLAATAKDLDQKNAELKALAVKVKDLDSALVSAAAATESAAPRYGANRVDIFYCADRAARNKPLAEQARTLGRDGTTQGRWQVRELSEKSNAAPGYGLRSDVIRFESDEKTMAGLLRDDVTQLTRVPLSAQQISYRTPNYVSVFFCGEG